MPDQNQLDDVYGVDDEPSGGRWKGCLLGGCIVSLVLCVLVCCGGLIALLFIWKYLVALILGYFVAGDPLPAPTDRWDDAQVAAVEQRVTEELEQNRTLTLSGEELGQWAAHEIDDPQLTVFHVRVDDQDRASLDLSYQLDPTQQQWINIHVQGEVEMEDGWFTEFVIHEMDLGDIDLIQQASGQDMTAEANQNLAQQRAQDPKVDQTMDWIEHLEFDDGQIQITFTEEGIEDLKSEGKL